MKPKIILTAGDPLGIGPEIAVKALSSRAAAGLDITIIGDSAALKAAGFKAGRAVFIPMDAAGLNRKERAPRAAAGLASFKAVELAIKLLKRAGAGALVTAPVSKEAWRLAGIPYTGHTELLRARTGREPLMGFTAGKARTALVTEHFSIRRVPSVITAGLVIEKARLFAEALKTAGIKTPRITLAALNPHAGDGGLLGMEEITILKPAVARLRAKGLDIKGPAPADAAWREHLNGRSDGLLCLYHDQALVPLKLIPGAERAVHWTWGLPFIRTSPAHGTAFDIAGRAIADAAGMKAAISSAAGAGNKR
ncbi:MAG: 4-hydroxythreonine-4-phosphate dehydrogenase PdxA [Elusimicrobia bacterium RIFOXYA12_FULL_51_18]|nr:MAG: 4-hydroxythreonine-4-phosphate dehydrogenase PdxA [Elusimicrobia bacterium RIFOXYA12_FULL_51_18]OGS32153.1 MAG: 4-hydroxythreonine-4-phosphate dehydrogenase PdxA [Elusimicrobia bacterium RIFOXYA2_FULL_53_38]